MPPPVRPGPALHRPGPRHRLGRPVGPAAPAVPAEVAGRRRREAGEREPRDGADTAGTPPGTPTAALQAPASTETPIPLCRTSSPCHSPGTPAADPSRSSPGFPSVPVSNARFLAAEPLSPQIPRSPPGLSHRQVGQLVLGGETVQLGAGGQ